MPPVQDGSEKQAAAAQTAEAPAPLAPAWPSQGEREAHARWEREHDALKRARAKGDELEGELLRLLLAVLDRLNGRSEVVKKLRITQGPALPVPVLREEVVRPDVGLCGPQVVNSYLSISFSYTILLLVLKYKKRMVELNEQSSTIKMEY